MRRGIEVFILGLDGDVDGERRGLRPGPQEWPEVPSERLGEPGVDRAYGELQGEDLVLILGDPPGVVGFVPSPAREPKVLPLLRVRHLRLSSSRASRA